MWDLLRLYPGMLPDRRALPLYRGGGGGSGAGGGAVSDMAKVLEASQGHFWVEMQQPELSPRPGV